MEFKHKLTPKQFNMLSDKEVDEYIEFIENGQSTKPKQQEVKKWSNKNK